MIRWRTNFSFCFASTNVFCLIVNWLSSGCLDTGTTGCFIDFEVKLVPVGYRLFVSWFVQWRTNSLVTMHLPWRFLLQLERLRTLLSLNFPPHEEHMAGVKTRFPWIDAASSVDKIQWLVLLSHFLKLSLQCRCTERHTGVASRFDNEVWGDNVTLLKLGSLPCV